MIQSSAMVDANFSIKGLNSATNPQPSDVQRQAFVSEASLDTAIGATVPAKDKPYLTMNDKVYAARFAVGGVVSPAVNRKGN